MNAFASLRNGERRRRPGPTDRVGARRFRREAQNVSEVYWLCRRCGACCRWGGYVRLLEGEAARLASFLGMTERAFVDRYARLTNDRKALSLIEQDDGACVFYEGEPTGCRVHEVKPAQCRAFPSGWRFPGFQRVCAAVAVPVEVGSRALLPVEKEGEDAPGG